MREGYDRVSSVYRPDGFDPAASDYARWLAWLDRDLRPGSHVLDLGCGCGLPVARALSERHAVLGVDLSPVQVERARRLVPRARFLCADMTTLALEPRRLDAIVCLYAVIHVPLAEQRALCASLARWLRPGGLLLVTVGHAEWTGTEDDWLGVSGATMYWSHAGPETYRTWLAEEGFHIVREDRVPEGHFAHPVLLARLERPGGAVTRRYLLWDHDGVLVDTERWYFEATRETLAGLGIELSQQAYLELQAHGRPAWELARERGLDEARIDAERDARNARYQELLRTRPIEIDGVREVLGELGASHRMAVVTTARRADLDLIHARSGLLEHFERVLSVEDYPRTKPHPDPYLAGLAALGGRPEQTLAFEDSARGLESARRAGLDCVVIRNAFTASQDFSSAWRVLDSIRQVPALLAGSGQMASEPGPP